MAFYGVFIECSKLNHTGNCVINYVCIKGQRHTIKGAYTSYFLRLKRGYASYFLWLNRTKTPHQTLKKGVFRAITPIDKGKPRLGLGEKHRQHSTQSLRGTQTYSVRTQLHRYTDNSYSGAPPCGDARGCPEADCSKVEYKDKTIGKKWALNIKKKPPILSH